MVRTQTEAPLFRSANRTDAEAEIEAAKPPKLTVASGIRRCWSCAVVRRGGAQWLGLLLVEPGVVPTPPRIDPQQFVALGMQARCRAGSTPFALSFPACSVGKVANSPWSLPKHVGWKCSIEILPPRSPWTFSDLRSFNSSTGSAWYGAAMAGNTRPRLGVPVENFQAWRTGSRWGSGIRWKRMPGNKHPLMRGHAMRGQRPP